MARHAAGADRRRDDAFASFRAFNRSLRWDCAAAPPVDLPVAPNASWPDLVYYNSFTHDGECRGRTTPLASAGERRSSFSVHFVVIFCTIRVCYELFTVARSPLVFCITARSFFGVSLATVPLLR